MSPSDIATRTKKLQEDPVNTMDTICSHVASGGSLIELCEIWEVRFGDMTAWISKDRDRRARYVDAQNDRCEWATEAIILELRRIGMSDIRKIYDDSGNLLPVNKWPLEVAHFVSSIDTVVDKDGDQVVKVKLWKKEKALELLGKNLSMFIDKIQHSGKLSLEDLITASREDEQQKDKS